METIIVYAQFLEPHESIIKYGLHLANHLQKKLRLIHVIDTRNMDFYKGFSDPDGTLASASSYELMEQHKKEADAFVERKMKEYRSNINTPIEARVEIGNTEIILSEEAKKSDTYLFMLPHNIEGEVRYLINDNSYYIEEARCPVMILPEKIEFQPVDKIIYATDYQEHDIASMKILGNFAEKFQASITALHVVDDPKQFNESLEDKGFKKLLQEEMKDSKFDFESIEGEDNIGSVIVNYAEANKGGVIAVLKENRGFWEKLFHSSVSDKIVDKSSLPVIVFNEDVFS